MLGCYMLPVGRARAAPVARRYAVISFAPTHTAPGRAATVPVAVICGVREAHK